MNSIIQEQGIPPNSYIQPQASVSNSQVEDIELESHKSQSNRLKQKPDRPIEVLSDEQEEQIINQQFKEELFRAKIQEAKLTKSKYNILKVLYVELNFRNLDDKQKQKKFVSMVKAYISKNLKTSTGEPFDIRNSTFFERMTARQDEEFVQNEYILYGCDLLSQRHIQKMFQAYTPSIKWINSSHCKLTFLQKIKGWEAVITNCRDLDHFRKQLEASIKVQNMMKNLQLQSEHQMEQQHQSHYNQEYQKLDKFKKEYHLLKNYVELMPYYELGFKRRLMIRNVTSAQQIIGYDLNGDVKSQRSAKQSISQTQENKPDSEFKKYLKVKQKLWKQIQTSPLVKPEYEKIQKQIEKEYEMLKLGKRPKIQQNKRQHYKPYGQVGYQSSYNKVYPSDGSNYDGRSQKSFNSNSNYSDFRNRSRDPSERNTAERGSYRGRGGQPFNRNYGRRTNYQESMEKHFDSYIQQREGLRILQKPHQFLEPQFIDKNTGTHFYKNPFYNPNTQRAYQKYSQPKRIGINRNYNNQNHSYGQQDQTLSEYQYHGNRQTYSGNYYNNFNQRGGNTQFSTRSGPNIYQNNNRYQRANQVEDHFNNYCAQRIDGNTQQQPNHKPKITPVTQNVSHYMRKNKNIQQNTKKSQDDSVFEGDADFSIITEEKPTELHARKDINDLNLENILDQIHDEQTPIQVNTNQSQTNQDQDESQSLEFLLEQRQRESVKNQIKLQPSSKASSNSFPNNQSEYIVEQIKQEHIQNWIKSSHDVQNVNNSEDFSRLIRNPQISTFNQHNFRNGQTSAGMPVISGLTDNINMKKKIPQKRSRNESQSLKKRSDQSLSKKQGK